MKQGMWSPLRAEWAIWVLILGGLITGIGIETDWGKRLIWPMALPDMSPAPFDNPVLAPPFALNPPDSYLETSLRPLFVITRRPVPPKPPEPAGPRMTMKKGQFTLTGTTIVDHMKFAHLVEKAGGKAHTVAEGKEINGLRIKEVGPTRIILSKENETEIVTLTTAKSPSPSPNKSFQKAPQTGTQTAPPTQATSSAHTQPVPQPGPASPPPPAGTATDSGKTQISGVQQRPARRSMP